MSLSAKKIDPFLIAVIPVLAFLLFWNLGNQFLWYDEAETAVLADSILSRGYPSAEIKGFVISTEESYGPGLSFIAQPWLESYVAAASFAMFGKSEWSARLPFALFGFFSFFLLYAAAARLFDCRTARIAVIIAAANVPFLLHLRQCRYYSLVVFFTLALLLAYLDFIEGRKHSRPVFTVLSFLLFQANFGCFVPVLAALLIHFFSAKRDRGAVKSFLVMYAWVFALVLPWAFLYKIWMQGGEGGFAEVLRNAKFYLSKINEYFFPYRFAALALAAAWAFGRRHFRFGENEKRALLFLSIIIAVNWVMLWFADFNSARYVIHIAGLFFIIEAFLAARLLDWNRQTGAVMLALLCFTNVLSGPVFYLPVRGLAPLVRNWTGLAVDKGILSRKYAGKVEKELGRAVKKSAVRCYFCDYIYEITHDYDGPLEGVVKYLRVHAKPGDTIKTHSYNDKSLLYYTDLRLDVDFSKESYPEWVYLRDYWNDDSFYRTEYFGNIRKRYQKIELEYPDIRYENRPDDLTYHHFRTAPLTRRATLYRRKD